MLVCKYNALIYFEIAVCYVALDSTLVLLTVRDGSDCLTAIGIFVNPVERCFRIQFLYGTEPQGIFSIFALFLMRTPN